MITNTLNKGHLTSIVMVKKSISGKNRSFDKKDGMFRIYKQEKADLSYFYGNREVHKDGVSTMALDI